MIIYLSGPVSGYTDRNKKVFQKAQSDIISRIKHETGLKIKVINPVKFGFKLDKQFQAAGKEPPVWEDYMRICIKELCQCDFVYLLSGWGNSQGAVVEKYLAERLKIPCAENMEELLKLVLRGIK